MRKINMPLDLESRRIKRASSRITYLCNFELNTKSFVDGLLEALVELNK